MARLSPGPILRPLLWLLWLVLLAAVLPALLIVSAPIFLLIWVVGLGVAIASKGLREELGVTPMGMALWLPLWVVLLVSTAVPALALGLALTQHFDLPAVALLPRFLGELGVGQREIALYCVVAGIVGFSSNCVYAFIDIPWRLKQIRQVRALPRSRTRSAAVGLAELEGIARAIGPDPYISKANVDKALPFHLEDETGRILVDPLGATVRPPSTSGASLQLNEIEQGIRDGDRVYAIGNVQLRDAHAPDALDADRLVLRPLQQRLVASPVARLFLPARGQPADRDTPNIFIVDKGREHDVVLRLRMALWDFSAIGAVYLASSLWLVQAAWPLMTAAG